MTRLFLLESYVAGLFAHEREAVLGMRWIAPHCAGEGVKCKIEREAAPRLLLDGTESSLRRVA